MAATSGIEMAGPALGTDRDRHAGQRRLHLGLTLALAPDAPAMVRRFAFQQAHHNLPGRPSSASGPSWPGRRPPRAGPRTLPAAELVRHLLPTARQGLEDAGVLAEEAGQLLSVIQARAASGQTGAAWQRQALAPRAGPAWPV